MHLQRRRLLQVNAGAEDTSNTQLSFAEELIWQAEVGGATALPFFDCARNLSFVVRLEGPLNYNALSASLDAVVQRHDVLLSRFVTRGGRPVRLSPEPSSPGVTIIDLRNVPQEDPSDIVQRVIKPRVEGPFDLVRGPLVRAILVALAADEHILAIAVHHIVFDRWSKRLLESELKQFYDAYVTGGASDVRPLPAHYRDYIVRQREQLGSDRSRKLTQYWTNRLAGLPDLMLPCNPVCGEALPSCSGTSWFTIPPEDVNRLIILSRQFRTTMAATMLAIFKLFLYRVTGVDDIAVGVPLSDRRCAEFEQLIGLFMNVVVVRTSFAASMTFFDLLDRVRRNLVDACLHQDLPYGYLLQTIATKPPYKVVFNFMPAIQTPDFQLAGMRAKRLPLHVAHKPVADLSLHVSSNSGALLCRLLYKPDLFSAHAGRKFATQIQTLTKSILDAPQNCADEYHIQ